jgi:hypothetical protein
MNTWYVRPDASHNITRNGTSYKNAWGGWGEIVWGGAGVAPTDTLVLCGTHVYSSNIVIGTHGATSESQRVTLSGDYQNDPGFLGLTGTAFFNFNGSYTILEKLKLRGEASSVIYYSAVDAGIVSECDIASDSGATTQTLISIAHNNNINSLTITKNYLHDAKGILGSSGRAIGLLAVTASRTYANMTIENNFIERCPDFGIRISIETAAADTSIFNNVRIVGNTVRDCGANGILVRSGPADIVTLPSIYSTGLLVYDNTVQRCGTIAGANGSGGGISVTGFASPIIVRNKVSDTYVTGAGIQTAKNTNTYIAFNDIRRIRSGTPTAKFNSGFPIDGNGIFLDNLTNGGIAEGNYIEGLISTGITNSGTGLAFWDCQNAIYRSNIVVDCYRGASYGATSESNNSFLNNTFFDCEVGIIKIGTSILTSNITARDNVMINCNTGIMCGLNPSINESYSTFINNPTLVSGIAEGVGSVAESGENVIMQYPSIGSSLLNNGSNSGYSRDAFGKQASGHRGAISLATFRG